MAFPAAGVFALENMWAMLERQRFISGQPGNDRMELSDGEAALLAELEILLEL